MTTVRGNKWRPSFIKEWHLFEFIMFTFIIIFIKVLKQRKEKNVYRRKRNIRTYQFTPTFLSETRL
jgi:hypothetical protein